MFELVYDRYYRQLKSGDMSAEIYSEYLNSFGSEYIKKYSGPDKSGRLVVDYISGMTDRYFNDCFTKFIMPKKFGRNILSADR